MSSYDKPPFGYGGYPKHESNSRLVFTSTPVTCPHCGRVFYQKRASLKPKGTGPVCKEVLKKDD